jgi:hypothetical protein
MRLVLPALAAALVPSIVVAQHTDFTVDPAFAVATPEPLHPKLTFRPRLTHDSLERFEPAGSREGAPAIDLRLSQPIDRDTEFVMKLFGELNGDDSESSPFREALAPKEERLLSLGFRRRF